MINSTIELSELQTMKLAELKEVAREMSIETRGIPKIALALVIFTHLQENEAQRQMMAVQLEIDTDQIKKETLRRNPLKRHNYTREEVKGLFGATRDQVYFLLSNDYSRVEIAKVLRAHYSQIHAIAKTWKCGTAITKSTESISGAIRRLHDAGWERAAICKKLGKDYSFVHNVIKAYERAKKKGALNADQETREKP